MDASNDEQHVKCEHDSRRFERHVNEPIRCAAPDVKEGLVVRPGDTLVLRIASEMREDDFRRFSAEMQSRLPEGSQVVVLAGDVEMGVVRGG